MFSILKKIDELRKRKTVTLVTTRAQALASGSNDREGDLSTLFDSAYLAYLALKKIDKLNEYCSCLERCV